MSADDADDDDDDDDDDERSTRELEGGVARAATLGEDGVDDMSPKSDKTSCPAPSPPSVTMLSPSILSRLSLPTLHHNWGDKW